MTGVDLTSTIIPKSDQLNSDDLIAGPRTFTVTEVRVKSTTEQPVDIHLAESPGKPFRPSKTVLRVLVTAWGKEGDEYVGRRMTLYRDAEVKWAGQEVGGIRVSHLSHITKPMKLALTETRGKKTTHIVQPLADAPPPTTGGGVTPAQLEQLASLMHKANITERDTWLAYIESVIDRRVSASKELTEAEASEVLTDLAYVVERSNEPTEPTLPEVDQ